MENNDLDINQENDILLKQVCQFIIGLFIVTVIIAIVNYIAGIVYLNTTTNTGIDGIGPALGVVMIVRLSQFSVAALVPLLIASICGKRYCSGKSNGNLTACWIWGGLSLLSSTYISYLAFIAFRLSSPFWLILAVFFIPNILYLKGCNKEQLKNNENSKS